MRHQDGTRPAEPARELTEEDRRFLELAMEEYAQARPAPVRCSNQSHASLCSVGGHTISSVSPLFALSCQDRQVPAVCVSTRVFVQAPVKRMQTIQEQLHGEAAGEEAVAQQEALLEELVEIVENIDFARGQPLVFAVAGYRIRNVQSMQRCLKRLERYCRQSRRRRFC